MTRGPKPVPREVRVARGNPSGRPLPEPVRVAMLYEAPKPPAKLPKAALAVWNAVVPPLIEVGIISQVDLPLVEAYCRFVARAREAEGLVEQEGLVIEGKVSKVVHPAVRVARDSWAQASALAEKLGLDPTGRTRLGLAKLQGATLAQELQGKYGG